MTARVYTNHNVEVYRDSCYGCKRLVDHDDRTIHSYISTGRCMSITLCPRCEETGLGRDIINAMRERDE